MIFTNPIIVEYKAKWLFSLPPPSPLFRCLRKACPYNVINAYAITVSNIFNVCVVVIWSIANAEIDLWIIKLMCAVWCYTYTDTL